MKWYEVVLVFIGAISVVIASGIVAAGLINILFAAVKMIG
jgi:hypothetical protein